MQDTLNALLAPGLELGWQILTVLTLIAVADMARNLLRRVRHIFP